MSWYAPFHLYLPASSFLDMVLKGNIEVTAFSTRGV